MSCNISMIAFFIMLDWKTHFSGFCLQETGYDCEVPFFGFWLQENGSDYKIQFFGFRSQQTRLVWVEAQLARQAQPKVNSQLRLTLLLVVRSESACSCREQAAATCLMLQV